MPVPDPISPSQASASSSQSGAAGAASKLTKQVSHQFGWLRDQAANKAGQLAESGKDQLAVKLDDVSGIIQSIAQSAEENYGPAASQYVQKAAMSLSSAAEGLRSKSVHGLVSSSRTTIRSNPGAAIGAATLIGFVAARIAKGGTAELDDHDVSRSQARPEPMSAGVIA